MVPPCWPPAAFAGLNRQTVDRPDRVDDRQTKEEVCRSGPRRKCSAWCKDEGIEIVDVRFVDLPGLMQHFSVPAHALTEDVFEEGFGFDGSSIRGFQEIQESDMLLMPDPNTAVIDPFREHKTLNLNCFVRDPMTLEPYSRDPRYVAHEGRGLPEDDRPRRHLLLRARGRVLHLRRRPVLPGPALTPSTRSTRSRGTGTAGGRTKGPNLGYKIRPEGGLLPRSPGGPLPGPALRDDPHHGAPRHRDRGAAPRGGHRRPGRDRHALRHAARRWPTSSCSTSTS